MSATPGTMRAALSHRSFRRLISGLAVSQAGDWLYNVALLAYVYERTHSAGWVAATTASRVLPIVLLAPFGGVLADRWDRRRTMVVSDLLRAACMLGLAGVAVTGLPVVLAPALAGLATAAAAPYPACTAATTPRLVPDIDLPGANAARSAVGMAAIAGGPAVGGVLLMLGSPAVAFLLNAGSFAVSALAVLSIPAGPVFRPSGADGAGSVLAGLRRGARALRSRPYALRLVGADITHSAVYGMQAVLLVLLARALGFGDAGYGWLIAGLGVGGVLGTALSGRAARSRHPRRVLVLALVGYGIPAALMAVTPCLTGLLVWAVASGASGSVIEVLSETGLQRALDEDGFAAAYGIAFSTSIGGLAGGSLVAAPLVALFGLAGAIVATGALVVAYVAVLLLPERSVGRHRAMARPAPVAA